MNLQLMAEDCSFLLYSGKQALRDGDLAKASRCVDEGRPGTWVTWVPPVVPSVSLADFRPSH